MHTYTQDIVYSGTASGLLLLFLITSIALTGVFLSITNNNYYDYNNYYDCNDSYYLIFSNGSNVSYYSYYSNYSNGSNVSYYLYYSKVSYYCFLLRIGVISAISAVS